ncbi:MAG: 2TM domain-containing protein [Anaerolineae bacterium]|nr:2TM domain-containing protein [Anaerolineae bacterium]
MTDQIDYQAIRKRVEKRFKQRQEAIIHLSAYVLVNIGVWVVWMFMSFIPVFVPVLITFGWGIGLAMHLLYYFFETTTDQRRESMIDREIRREKMRVYGDPDYDEGLLSKPKRGESDPALRLTDDGEIIASEEADPAYKQVARKKG